MSLILTIHTGKLTEYDFIASTHPMNILHIFLMVLTLSKAGVDFFVDIGCQQLQIVDL